MRDPHPAAHCACFRGAVVVSRGQSFGFAVDVKAEGEAEGLLEGDETGPRKETQRAATP